MQRWGDVVPGWVPVVGGFADDPTSGWASLMALCYAPALLWGPLLAAVTMAYWRRRRSAGARS